MSNGEPEVLVGYEVRNLYTARQSQEVVDDEEEIPSSEEDRDLQFSWDWQIPNLPENIEFDESDDELDAFWFDVAIGIRLGPSPKDPNRYEVTLVGQFVGRLEEQVPLHEFAHLNAVALLLPYLRERLNDLSKWGSGEPYNLPVVNVGQMMEQIPLAQSQGWKDLQDHPELAARLGLSEEDLEVTG